MATEMLQTYQGMGEVLDEKDRASSVAIQVWQQMLLSL